MNTAIKTAKEEITIQEILKPFALAALKQHFPQIDKYGNPSLSRFFFENGRLPYATDEIKPWKYRGWLIPYLQMCEQHPEIPARYDYVLRTLEKGQLLEEPIPQVWFMGERDNRTSEGYKMLRKCLDKIEYTSGNWNGMRDFCHWLSFGLGVVSETSNLKDEVQDFLYKTFNLAPLLLNATDYLGEMLCESNHGKKSGFYPTPLNICQLMAEMVKADTKGSDPRLEATHDPCVGTGRMLLVSSNFSLRLYGQDIDYLCCLITKINLALYAPWHYIPDSYFPEKSVETIRQSDLELKNDSGSPEKPIEAHQEELQTELSLYERLKLEKDGRKRQRKYSTVIEEQLTLF